MKMIVVVDEQWGIGAQGDLLTALPEDMAFFRRTTKGHVLVMGRKTLESFPGKKPLKDRVNIVITKQEGLEVEGCVMVSSVEEAMEVCQKKYPHLECFVAGGGSVYRQMLAFCDTAYVTKIYKTFPEAQVFIDNLDELPNWTVTERSEMKEYEGLKFQFLTYKSV